MAPEIFKNGEMYTEKVDVYSLAVILHEMLVGGYPDVSEGKPINGLPNRFPLIFR